jgi:hypothetical protein
VDEGGDQGDDGDQEDDPDDQLTGEEEINQFGLDISGADDGHQPGADVMILKCFRRNIWHKVNIFTQNTAGFLLSNSL